MSPEASAALDDSSSTVPPTIAASQVGSRSSATAPQPPQSSFDSSSKNEVATQAADPVTAAAASGGEGRVRDRSASNSRSSQQAASVSELPRPPSRKASTELPSYKLEGNEGIGGSRRVFVGLGADRNKVAMKRCIIDSSTGATSEKIKRELKLLHEGRHQNIIALLAPCVKADDPGLVYSIFPFVEHDLAALLSDDGGTLWELSTVRLMAQQLMAAVAHLHENDILHRNIEPTNILVTNDGVLKLGSFGSARKAAGGSYETVHTRLDLAPNSAMRWYKPPELMLGFPKLGAGMDVWAVGCVIGEMATKRPILPGVSDADQMSLIWQLCGRPSTKRFPEWNRHGGCPGDDGGASLGEHSSQYHVAAYSSFVLSADRSIPLGRLVSACLSLDPADRPTASSLLQHEFLTTKPAPTAKPAIPPLWYGVSHTGGRRLSISPSSQRSDLRRSNPPSGTASSSSRPLSTRSQVLPPSSKTVRPEDIIVIDSDDDDDEGLDLQRVAFRIFGPPDIEQEMAAAEARRARLKQADELQQALLDSQHAADERQQQVKELQQKVFTQAQEISTYVLSAIAQEKAVERAGTIITEQRDAIAKADRLAVEQKTKADAESVALRAALDKAHQTMRDLQTEREVLTETIRQQAEAIRLGTAKQGAQQKDIDLYMAGLSAAQAEVEALTAEVERRKPDALALSDALVEIKTLSTEIQKRNATIYFAELELAKQKEEIDARSAEAYRDGKVGALENKCAQLKTDVDGQKETVEDLRGELATANQALDERSAQAKTSEEQQARNAADLKTKAKDEVKAARASSQALLELKQQSIDSLELEVESLRALAAERDALVSTIKSERDTSRHALQELTLELEQARAEAGHLDGRRSSNSPFAPGFDADDQPPVNADFPQSTSLSSKRKADDNFVATWSPSTKKSREHEPKASNGRSATLAQVARAVLAAPADGDEDSEEQDKDGCVIA